MEGEIKIRGSYKGLYVLSSTERSIQVKVHEITSEYLLHFLLKLKEIQHAGGKANQNKSSLCKYRPRRGPTTASRTAGGCGEGGNGGVVGDETSSRAADATGESAGLPQLCGIASGKP